MCMHVYISLLEVQSKWDQFVRGGVLSIGTAPPRARRTEGMRYIVKPKKLNLSRKVETAQQALQRGVQPPVKNRGEISNVRKLSRTNIETEENRRFVVRPKPLDNSSCVYSNITSCFQTNQSYV